MSPTRQAQAAAARAPLPNVVSTGTRKLRTTARTWQQSIAADARIAAAAARAEQRALLSRATAAAAAAAELSAATALLPTPRGRDVSAAPPPWMRAASSWAAAHPREVMGAVVVVLVALALVSTGAPWVVQGATPASRRVNLTGLAVSCVGAYVAVTSVAAASVAVIR